MQLARFVSVIVVWHLIPSVHAFESTADIAAGFDSTIDYLAFYDCFDGPDAPVPAACSTSNFHPDTHIDLADFAVIQRGYPLVPGEIQFATETAGQVDPIDDVDEYLFDAVFGSTVTVDFVTPSVNNRPDLVVRLDLIRPNGTTASTTASCATTARLDTIAVDATGTWKVRVRGYESWASCGYGSDEALRTGLYTLTVCTSNAQPLAIDYGQTRTNIFTADCQIINYEFAGEKGDVASVMYLGPASTRRVRLYAPNGALLATSGGGAGTSVTDVSLPLSGAYRIAVEAADGQTLRTFSIGLSKLEDAVPIAFSTLTPGSLGQPAQVETFSFEGVFGSTVTVDFATPTVDARPDLVVRLDLIRPNGTTASTTASCATTTRLDTIPIDATGTWTIRVRAYESWFSCGYGPDTRLITGSYALIVCPSNATPAPIAYGETVDGSFDVDCQIVNYEFDGTKGDVITIMYLGPAHVRRVRLFAPNGALLATSGGGQGVSITDVTLPLTGLYRIAVEAADNQPVGDFSVGLSRLASSTPILQAAATPGTLDLIAQVDTYSFAGVFGNTVTVDLSTPLVLTRPDLVTRLDLIRPNGTLASTTASCGVNARLDSIVLDATGTWAVRVRAYESWFSCGYGPDTDLLTGDYTIAMCTSDAPATAIDYGESRDGTLHVDCEIVNYELVGETNDVVTIAYYGTAYTRRVRLYAPGGALLATSGGGLGAFLTDVTLPANGVYRIAVEAADNQPVGDFSIGLSKLGVAAPITLDTSTPGTLGFTGETAAFAFAGTFGTTATVDYATDMFEGRPDIVARIDLIRPNGSQASTTATCGANARLDTVALDATGVWTVRVRAYESWFSCGYGSDTTLLTGDFTLGVSTSDAPPVDIDYGQTRNGDTVVDSQILNFEFAGLLGDYATAVYYGPAYLRRLRLVAPNHSVLATSGGGLGAALLDVPLPLDGIYRLTVEAADNQPTGAFSIGLSELSDATPLSLNVATPGTVDEIGRVRQFSFNRTNGDAVGVDLATLVSSGRPDLALQWDLVRPDGTVASTSASCGGSARVNNITINQTGLWTLRVRAYESWSSCGFGPDTALLTGAFTIKVCTGSCP